MIKGTRKDGWSELRAEAELARSAAARELRRCREAGLKAGVCRGCEEVIWRSQPTVEALACPPDSDVMRMAVFHEHCAPEEARPQVIRLHRRAPFRHIGKRCPLCSRIPEGK